MSYNIFLLHLVQQTERLNPFNHVTRSVFLANRLRLSCRCKKLEIIKGSFLEWGGTITGGKMNVCSLSSDLSNILWRNKAARSPLIALKRFLVIRKKRTQGSSLFRNIQSRWKDRFVRTNAHEIRAVYKYDKRCSKKPFLYLWGY